MLQVQLITSRSQQSRILQAPLYYEENRVAALPFAFFMRYYLGFPRLLRKGDQRPLSSRLELGQFARRNWSYYMSTVLGT